uniref:Mitochondrial carrier protein n=1 Tax=Mesocestoides corti TaxID=53468 RepID=A0A5K3ER16_MESCO
MFLRQGFRLSLFLNCLWYEIPTGGWAGRIRLFWAGTVPSLWRCVPGICAYFSMLDFLETYLPRVYPSVDAFILGFTARSLVGGLLLPFTVVKTHAEAGLTRGLSTFSSISQIYAASKWRGLFSGIVPTLARDSPYSGIYLLFYTKFKARATPSGVNSDRQTTPTLGVCAFLAAFCATAVTQPADVLRSNRQLSIAVKGAKPATWTRVVSDVLRVDGITGLWRGFSLRLARRAVFAVVSWTLFDSIPERRQSSLRPTS